MPTALIIIAFVSGAWFALSVFVPRLRWSWAGTGVEMGRLGSLAASVVLLSWAVRRTFHDSLSDFFYRALFCLTIVGWIFLISGYIIIRRRAKHRGMTQDLERP